MATPAVPIDPKTGMPAGQSTDDIVKNQLRGQEQGYNQLTPGLANSVTQGINNSPAANMFNPDLNATSGAAFAQGLGGATGQQQQLGNEADAYDQFANGAGGQMQGGIDKQQNQADYMWQNPGYTGQEKSQMMTAAGTPIAGAYNSAAHDLKNTAAITGNSAAVGAQTGQLARQKAQDLSMAGMNMQGQFANQRIAGMQAANQAQSGVNSQQQGAANSQSNIRQGGANIRMGAAGSNLQTAQVGNSGMGTQQNAAALSLAPAQLAAGMYGTVQNAANGATGQQTSMTNTGMNTSLGTQLSKGAGSLLGNVNYSGKSAGGFGIG